MSRANTDQAYMIARAFSTRETAAAMAYLVAQESGLTHSESIAYALLTADAFDSLHRRIPDWMEEAQREATP